MWYLTSLPPLFHSLRWGCYNTEERIPTHLPSWPPCPSLYHPPQCGSSLQLPYGNGSPTVFTSSHLVSSSLPGQSHTPQSCRSRQLHSTQRSSNTGLLAIAEIWFFCLETWLCLPFLAPGLLLALIKCPTALRRAFRERSTSEKTQPGSAQGLASRWVPSAPTAHVRAWWAEKVAFPFPLIFLAECLSQCTDCTIAQGGTTVCGSG